MVDNPMREFDAYKCVDYLQDRFKEFKGGRLKFMNKKGGIKPPRLIERK